MVAGSRIGLALGGLFLLDQPCRWSHHQRLPRFSTTRDRSSADRAECQRHDGDRGKRQGQEGYIEEETVEERKSGER